MKYFGRAALVWILIIAALYGTADASSSTISTYNQPFLAPTTNPAGTSIVFQAGTEPFAGKSNLY